MTLPVGFGTWPLGGRAYGPIEDEIAIAALEEAVNQGIRIFDTADIYGDGRAERLLGQVISTVPDAIVISKAGYIAETKSQQDFSEFHLCNALETTLHRLRRNKLDVFLLHSPPKEVLCDGNVFKVLDHLQQDGLVAKTGVSLRAIDTFETVLTWSGCSVVEVILNLLDQRFIDSGFLDLAAQRGIQVIARIPLCFGFLSGRYRVGAVFAPGDQRSRWSQEQIDSWIEGAEHFRFLERPDRSLAQAAIAFCIGLQGVTCVIPGMKTSEQVRHNVRAAKPVYQLTNTEMAMVREVWCHLKHITP